MVLVFRSYKLTIIILFNRNHNSFLDEVGGLNSGVGVQLSKVLELGQAVLVLDKVHISFKVWISKTIFDGMSQLLATHASHVLLAFCDIIAIFFILF